MTFNIKEDSFYLDEKKVFLISGEIHYFRIKRELWDKHLLAAKEAGLNAVSTYIPWAWHEYEEHIFDFEGSSCPERDLSAWLERCNYHGMLCIVKPGPFILAEYRGAGLPDWFLEKDGKELKMKNSKGEIVPSDGVSLFNPKYLEKVGLWYDKIMPFIAERQLSAGGPIIMMQICNEIGVFSWLARQADYGGAVQERFIYYLSSKFNSIDELNKLWGTSYSKFSSIELPPDGKIPYRSKADRGRDYEWHLFWRNYYGNYLRLLTDMARDRGVSLPLYHNLPGWIYGNGYEFPVNITMYEDLFENKSDIIFGVDHIPEFFSYRNLHDDRIINDITRAMQGNKPLFAAEFQCGSREYHVETNPREMELFYKASVANGLVGWNYYMFSQGRNPERKGYSGDTFYWFNPLTPEAEKGTAFPLVKRMNKIIKELESIIVNAKRKAEICVLFYPPYYATELERPVEKECELVFTPSSIRRSAYFDGLLKVLQVMDIDYDMVDLNKATVGNLAEYKQVWVFATDEMNAREQQTLVDYTKTGGNMVIYPYLPDRENSQNPCTIIRDAIAIIPSGIEFIDSPLIDVLGFKDIKCANPQVIYDEQVIDGSEIFARNMNGNVCGFAKTLGKGTIIHLGAWLGFDTEGHKPVYEAFLNQSKAKLRQAFSNNYHVNVRQRFTKEQSALLFIGNYYNEEHKAKISYTHPETGETMNIPYSGKEILWPALYGTLSPINLKVSEGLKILHSTSDILKIKVMNAQVEISLYGSRDLPGEIVFELENGTRFISATVADEDDKMVIYNKHIVFNYEHKHKSEIVLRMILKY